MITQHTPALEAAFKAIGELDDQVADSKTILEILARLSTLWTDDQGLHQCRSCEFAPYSVTGEEEITLTYRHPSGDPTRETEKHVTVKELTCPYCGDTAWDSYGELMMWEEDLYEQQGRREEDAAQDAAESKMSEARERRLNA
jgi:hypothetical protein